MPAPEGYRWHWAGGLFSDDGEAYAPPPPGYYRDEDGELRPGEPPLPYEVERPFDLTPPPPYEVEEAPPPHVGGEADPPFEVQGRPQFDPVSSTLDPIHPTEQAHDDETLDPIPSKGPSPFGDPRPFEVEEASPDDLDLTAPPPYEVQERPPDHLNIPDLVDQENAPAPPVPDPEPMHTLEDATQHNPNSPGAAFDPALLPHVLSSDDRFEMFDPAEGIEEQPPPDVQAPPPYEVQERPVDPMIGADPPEPPPADPYPSAEPPVLPGEPPPDPSHSPPFQDLGIGERPPDELDSLAADPHAPPPYEVEERPPEDWDVDVL